MWKSVEMTPIWTLRLLLLGVGALAAAGIGMNVIADMRLHSDPDLEIRVTNRTSQTTDVTLDGGTPMSVLPTESLQFEREAEGKHKLVLNAGEDGDVTAEFQFDGSEWGNDFQIEVGQRRVRPSE